ncbi:MAG: type II toxin-antitoxin system PemK/MazF family toxin [Nakamurella sp.]
MRRIHLARLDKTRPVLILTRETAFSAQDVTVAGITSTIRGVATELPVGKDNGLDDDSVVNLDDVQTIRREDLGRFLGYLTGAQEPALHRALIRAFDLED